ncbi:response regulator [Halorhodospira halochloris]|uniref:Chemotaxis regulator-transmits chemoreceptor signals to flagelllar motor components CheY n=1 Tax=Halorhodospira halochloris TaxID=1052 RepID=A0A0X8X8V9_HALHR|nr:response regulator [Halorhodospira halochloris]MBK1651394.1 two-component system response regulator [Halorhodospira halochloris]MCG5531172.1 response regulator [Halorhodospira halochloris]MCG5547546.1 response regulator [Halorhodospira halochloris]BAU57681.1 chemotaxis regulator - transmits chemoreceptor signals to flagelllar motor components CheY [Halorhodospira halochloris]
MLNKITAAELTALLIEPSDVQRRILTQSLQDAGLSRLESTNSLAHARELVEQRQPDLIISAMYLPDGTAEDFLLELRNNPDTHDQAFMLVSSVRDRQRLETLRQSGVNAILPKPFSAEDLDRAVRSSIDILSEEELELEYFDITALRILLVDDSRLARNYIRRVLESIGAEYFIEATNGNEAVKVLHETPIDLVVTDYNMPEMDGRELTNYIRENAAFVHLPILMISSTDDQASLSAVTQAGVDAICDKPFSPETARQTLCRLLGE